MAIKKGPTKGSGGKHRNALRGKGPTPKAEDRVYHKAYKAKQATNRRKMADPRLAARRRAAKFTSDSDDLVIGRNAVPGVFGVVSPDVFLGGRTGPAVALLAAVPSSGPPGVVPLLLTCCHRPSL